MAGILVVAENYEGRLRSATFHAVQAALSYAKVKGESDVFALVLGTDASKLASELALYPLAEVFCLEQPDVAHYTAEAYSEAIYQFLEARPFDTLIGASSTFAKDLFPRLAERLRGGMVNEVLEILAPDRFKRPMFAGSVIATVRLEGDLKLITIRPTAFDTAPKAQEEAKVTPVGPFAISLPFTAEFVQFEEVKSERPKLTEAKRVISGGRGLKSAENFHSIIEPLADTLGAAIGASRAAVDSGFCPNDYQVGQTGKVVAPDLYVAVGISGAIQHMAGMKDSKVIVAVNKDEEAPIFEIADYGLVADLFKAVPEMIGELKKVKSA
jgi:electron transfer flavoprotein alpha subunit